MSEAKLDEDQIAARERLVKLAASYRETIDEEKVHKEALKKLSKVKVAQSEEILQELLELGGNMRFTLDEVITLWPETQVKAWTDKERKEEAIVYFQDENIQGVVSLSWQSVQTWAKEQIENGETLPSFIKTSDNIVLRHRSSSS